MCIRDRGSANLEKMRGLVSDRGPINERSDAFGKEAMSLMGVIAKLQQTSVAPAVKRAADGLVAGFIAPAADGRGDLAERQTSVVGKVETAVAAQAAALSQAADKILDTPPVEPARFQPLSTAEAVLRYAGDFLPSWAGAISIDLMPAVLVFIPVSYTHLPFVKSPDSSFRPLPNKCLTPRSPNRSNLSIARRTVRRRIAFFSPLSPITSIRPSRTFRLLTLTT